MKDIFYGYYVSPTGILKITSNGKCITTISFTEIAEEEKPDEITMEAVRQLEKYFKGERHNFTLPLEIRGTPYQKKVYNALGKIPYGKTVTYGELAEMVNSSPRAIGHTLHSNPLLIVIPCHRVIKSDGTIGGYVGTTEVKKELLRREGIVI